jgi:hypothetical protein
MYRQHNDDPTHGKDYAPQQISPGNMTTLDYAKKTNEELFYSKELPTKYKTSYLDHKGNWIHKCDCGYKSGLNPLTNCKCGYDQYLDVANDKCVSWIDAQLIDSINFPLEQNN